MKFILIISFSFLVFAKDAKKYILNEKDKSFFEKVFKKFSTYEIKNIGDPIDEEAGNPNLLIVKDNKENVIGYLRDIVTSTGCNDGCLPVIFTLFFGPKGEFIKLLSKEGLTKKNHEPFTVDDYVNLEMIILRNPEEFKQVLHPKQMVDAVTSETLNLFRPHVINKAAYTTLRVNKYFEHTQKSIKEIIK